jgi:hypothetical protein
MKIGAYTLRKPWVKMVDIELAEEVYTALRASIVDDMINEAKADAKYNVEILRLYREKG